MALPYNLLEKEKSFRKLCRGVGLLKKRWKEILLGFLLLHLIMAVVGGVFYVLSTLGMTGAAMLFKPEAGKISSVLIGREYIQMAMGVFTGGVQMTGTLAFADTVYSRLPRKSREEVPL